MRYRTWLFTAAAMWAGSTTAYAQTSQLADPQPEQARSDTNDIVVTAQHRAERVQDIPITLTAVTSETLERRSILTVADLPSVAPGLSVGQGSGYSRIYIRGVGSGSVSSGQDPSVSMQLDGVVIARPFAQLSAFFDIDRVEVLRGPQGTLYGRNATGGTINVVTRAPTRDLSGYLDLTYGNYNHFQVDGAISGPLTANGDVRARIAFQRVSHDGYGRNLTLGQDIDDVDSWAVRGSLRIDPASWIDISVTADYARENDHNYSFTAFGPYLSNVTPTGIALGGTYLLNSRDVTQDSATTNDREIWGISSTFGVELGSGLRLQTILGYRDAERTNTGDVDTTSATVTGPLLISETSKHYSAETQLLYQSGRVNGVVGAFYFHEHLDSLTDLAFVAAGRALGVPNADFRPEGTLNIEAKALYTQWTVEPIDGLRLTAGLRYSDENRQQVGQFTIFNFLPPPNGRNLVIPTAFQGSWNAFTPRFVIDYKPTQGVMLYASATRGFKSGVILIGVNPPVNPEYIWAYEAGVKTQLLDNRLQLNAAAFYYDFTDLQVNRVINNQAVTENAAQASVRGFEIEMRAIPTPGITLNAALTYLDARYDEYSTQNAARPQLGPIDLSGNQLPYAPRWTINAGAEADIHIGLPGRLSLRGDVRYSSQVYFSEFNDENVSQKPYTLVDASLRWESPGEHWQASLFVRNLGNVDVRSSLLVAAAATGFTINGGYMPPRTYGIRVGYHF